MWGDFQAYEGSYNFKYGGPMIRNLHDGGLLFGKGIQGNN
jgi:hypothetical protein